jgi:hypothetical protein
LAENVITSKQIIKLLEEFHKDGKVYGSLVTVYVNPTSSDIVKMVKHAKEYNRDIFEVRFIADFKNKKVYIADSYDIIHDDMYTILGFRRNSPAMLDGLAKLSGGGSLVMHSWDKFLRSYISRPEDLAWFKEAFNYNWTFVDRYVRGCSSFIANVKKQFDELMKERSKKY